MSGVVTPPLTIYCARPMSGRTRDEIIVYYKRVGARLSDAGFKVFTPVYGKGYLRNLVSTAALDRRAPVVTDRALKQRDQWMVRNSDVIFVNLIGATQVSIGSVMELAWADVFGVHSVLVLDKSDIHRHPIVLECADIIFPAEEEALLYLGELVEGRLFDQ